MNTLYFVARARAMSERIVFSGFYAEPLKIARLTTWCATANSDHFRNRWVTNRRSSGASTFRMTMIATINGSPCGWYSRRLCVRTLARECYSRKYMVAEYESHPPLPRRIATRDVWVCVSRNRKILPNGFSFADLSPSLNFSATLTCQFCNMPLY